MAVAFSCARGYVAERGVLELESGEAMGDETAVLGPISYLIVEFPGNKMTGEGFAALLDLVDRGVIRILDLLFVTRDDDGSMRALDLQDIDRDGHFDLAVFAGASSGLLSESDLAEAASAIDTWICSRDFDLRESLGRALRRGAASGRRRTRLGRLYPAIGPCRGTRRDGRLIQRRKDETMPLLRGIARTAAIAGTATAVSNRVSRRQQNRWAQQEEPQYAQPQQYAPPPASAPARDPIAQLKDLAELKSQGVLTEAEFEAQKARILA